MGEYAEFNGGRIKIGTCECMYYLRWDDQGRIDPMTGNVDFRNEPGLFFRLPFPDEDDRLPGDYDDPFRGLRLGKRGEKYWEDWTPEDMEDHNAGTIQLRHDCGLLLNVPCHHGEKLPVVGPDVTAFWNGKSHALELRHVKSMPGGKLRPVYVCRFCDSMWSTEWEEILPYCELDKELQKRLEAYAAL